jgi:hypothetical protein
MAGYIGQVEIKMCVSNGGTFLEQKRILSLDKVSDVISVYKQIEHIMDAQISGSLAPEE